MPTLYVLATPIGNLRDVTLRALEVLRSVGLVAAEDTRTARRLLHAHGIAARCVSYQEHNRARRIPQLLDALEKEDVALLTEAGTPGISDPGSHLVAAALDAGFPVVAVPGPSAVTAALSVSGLPASRFLFLGFPPARPGPRRRFIEAFASFPYTVVLFEAPHRLRATLADLAAVLGTRRLAVCHELTKVHEEVFRGTAAEALEHFAIPKGEFTLVIEGAGGELDDGRKGRRRAR